MIPKRPGSRSLCWAFAPCPVPVGSFVFHMAIHPMTSNFLDPTFHVNVGSIFARSFVTKSDCFLSHHLVVHTVFASFDDPMDFPVLFLCQKFIQTKGSKSTSIWAAGFYSPHGRHPNAWRFMLLAERKISDPKRSCCNKTKLLFFLTKKEFPLWLYKPIESPQKVKNPEINSKARHQLQPKRPGLWCRWPIVSPKPSARKNIHSSLIPAS